MWTCPQCGRSFSQVNQSHTCGKIATIDGYIAACPAAVQPFLQKIRETIHSAAPDAQETIAWRMPTFRQGENLIYFAAFQNHISIFPGGEATSVFANRLSEYKTSKGTIQFPLGRPIDYELIAAITRWRVEQVRLKARSGTQKDSDP